MFIYGYKTRYSKPLAWIFGLAQQEHQNIVNYLSKANIGKMYLIGSYFSKTKTQLKNCYQFANFDAFKKAFKNNLPANTTILIKASRAMALERIVTLL